MVAAGRGRWPAGVTVVRAVRTPSARPCVTISGDEQDDVNDLVAVCAGVFGLALFAGLILVPAWTSYSRLWERVAASILSLYVLAVLVGIGVAAALAVVYFWG